MKLFESKLNVALDDPEITMDAAQKRVLERLQEQNVQYAALNAAQKRVLERLQEQNVQYAALNAASLAVVALAVLQQQLIKLFNKGAKAPFHLNGFSAKIASMKKLFDAVHGFIHFNELETLLLDSAIFTKIR